MSEAETTRRYPCDELVPAPSLSAWRGVTVRADAERVWPWVAQIRLAPYSYDWVDNLGRRSPRELRDLREPAVGDPFTATAGRPLGRIEQVVTGESLTGRIAASVLSYVLVPTPEGHTRLLLKVVLDGFSWLAPMVSVGDLVMARKQLLTWKSLAEERAADG